MRNALPRTAAISAVLLAAVAVPAAVTASAAGPAAATPALSRPATAATAPLTLRYQLTGASQHGGTTAGPRSLAFTVLPQHRAAPAPVTMARVQVSFDGGTTWQPASLRRTGAASFRAGFTAPAGHQVSLRVTVHTKAGAWLTETLLGAYQAS